MTDEGCDNRLYAAEWHAELERRFGLPQELYEQLNTHLTECVKADYFNVPRPQTNDEFLRAYEKYMDEIYAHKNGKGLVNYD